MIPREKIRKFQKYLQKDLSGKTLGCEYDVRHRAEIFTLTINDHTVTISVPEEFFNDNNVEEIKKKLKNFRLLEFVRHGWSKRISVTKFGLILEDY